MQEILWRLRHRPAAAPITTDVFLFAELLDIRTLRARRHAALARPTILRKACLRDISHLSSLGCLKTTRSSPGNYARPKPSLQLGGYRANGGLGQLRGYHGESLSLREKDHHRLESRNSPITTPADDTLREVRYWERRLLKAQARQGPDGVWKLFRLFTLRRFDHLLVHPQADSLRDRFLVSLVDDDTQLAKLVSIARELRVRKQFVWPNLYEKILHSFLSRTMYAKALTWHWHLAPDLLPTADMFGVLLANLATHEDLEMQNVLETLYSLQVDRRLYDHMIPTLYRAGRSKQARAWRQKLLDHQDYPMTSKSQPFLRFLQRYYPHTQLHEEELFIANSEAEMGQQMHSEDGLDINKSDAHTETYSDSLVAKWLATQWMPLDFAINFVLNLGLRTMGPRSLQSLALRESDAKGVTERIKTLEKRGIETSKHVYCEALVHFARSGEDQLLSSLLDCDVHPNEFDDSNTRRMLLAASLKRGDTEQAELFRAIERTISRTGKPFTLMTLLEKELSRGEGRNFRWVLRRMKELNIPVGQSNAKRFLQHAFKDINWHPKRSKQDDSQVTAAIDTIRLVSRHDVAIPIWCWRKLLTNLGRGGRLDDLDQLALEIVDLYQPQHRELIPVYHRDLPGAAFDGTDESITMAICSSHEEPQQQLGLSTSEVVTNNERLRVPAGTGEIEDEEKEDVPEYIPSDLDFSHQEHPLYKIFDTSLQRSIIRWGFDRMLAQKPRFSASQQSSLGNTANFDVARGVRLLAMLRDQGIVIQKDLVRAAVLARIVLSQMPGRPKNRARDAHEISTQALKTLFDDAWGSELLPDIEELLGEVERQKLQTLSRYPKLFGKAFDDEYDNTE